MTSDVILHFMQNLWLHNVIIYSKYSAKLVKNHENFALNEKKLPSMTFEVKLHYLK